MSCTQDSGALEVIAEDPDGSLSPYPHSGTVKKIATEVGGVAMATPPPCGYVTQEPQNRPIIIHEQV